MSYKTLAVVGPQVRGNQMGFITPAISVSTCGENLNGLHHPCHLRILE